MKPDNIPATLAPVLPEGQHLDELRDQALAVVRASAQLDGSLHPLTADTLRERVKLLNSYHSNLIEGSRTSIFAIEAAYQQRFSPDDQRRYAQELGLAHVETESTLLRQLAETPRDICSTDFLLDMHREFFSHLPEAHQYVHSGGRFTDISVAPGQLRDREVSVDGGASIHGPLARDLPGLMHQFAEAYAPDRHHGLDRLIAAAASHHRLTWLHPFRDGNGRVVRLLTELYLRAAGINESGAWSFSRGISRDRAGYFIHLNAADPQRDGRFGLVDLADFCAFVLETCLDQISFMATSLDVRNIALRYQTVVHRHLVGTPQAAGVLRPEDAALVARLLALVFETGAMERGMATMVLGKSQRTGRRVLSLLLRTGLLQAATHVAPVRVALPTFALSDLFPPLFPDAVVGGPAL
ncbi:Fic family protein [Nitratidesulfovibrio liaohensis]|uniref:Fic family protein n=1 Tax=Nitratidesulfovibrio liaohensis TaxID=2604158 RepID=UPI0014230C5A|nr:Fic family protein [Nitratidesulfovibrio liaohensis]NHZ45954.1 Fic family protein [Nitratidesulfovibrio liaohensis]